MALGAPRETPSRSRGRTGTGLVLLGVFVLLIGVVASVGGRDDGGFILLQQMRFGPGYGALSLALICVGLLVRHRTVWRIVASAVTVTIGGLGLAGLVAISLIAGPGPFDAQQRVAAPGKRYTAHVITRYHFIDPVVEVRVEQRRGLLSRAWQVGCTGDDTLRTQWTSADRLRLTGADGTSDVELDRRTGRPLGDLPDVLQTCSS